MFIGMLLVTVFIVGLIVDMNPRALIGRYRQELSLELFGVFCSRVWLPAGIIGIPLFLVSLIISLISEKKNKE